MSASRLACSQQKQGYVTSALCKVFVGILCLTTLFSITVPPANADEFSVFGPQVFDRAKGKPLKERVIVHVPEAENNYLLRVQNPADGRNSVSSGRVSLNGELIIGPKELNKRSPIVERNVFLSTTNELVVEIKGHSDSGLVLEIVGIDSNGVEDGDGDGVGNDLDQCPGTSQGEPVDENGCSPSQLDDDNDGVTNDLDQCPETPTESTVDENGCADSQLDDDGDGVDNSIDQCPNTEPGAPVDANGCAIEQPDDDDGDGVSNEFDECPGTLPGESVDANGCSPSQVDDDNDGVTNDLDQCPGTPAGVAVDSSGCEIGSDPLPPDPAAVADPLDPAAITSFKEAVEFLYASDTPVQTNVIASNISDKSAAVIRGAIIERSGEPISGVTISIHKHPEFGQTLSRHDGLFDLAVNGGRRLIVNYEKPGYLPVQRRLEVPQRDFVTLETVVMISMDTQVSTIDLSDNSKDFQIARGSVQTDNDGSRQVTVLFPQGTGAAMTLADGSTRSLTTLSVRGTEYTVGDNGPETMPGELPATSGYTYAVELSVDEAIAAGATRVDFSQPLSMYVDNFLNFPTGMVVPMGWYDRDSAAWVASENGQVVEILDIKGGLAVLDVDGSGMEASAEQLAAMGISDGERRQLAALYSPGKTLWRSLITHFTPWDCNWPYGLPEDAEPPQQPEPDIDETEVDPCEQSGSIIECQNAVLRERFSIAGTPFNLNYRSDIVPGRKAYADINLSGDTIPPSLQYIDLRVSIAGQLHSYRFPAQSNLTHRFIWDGMDAYGRQAVGKQYAKISIGYVYPGIYYEPAERRKSFGVAGGAPISRNRTRTTISIWQTSGTTFQSVSPAAGGLGGWLITPQHHYDPASDTLTLGNGTVQDRQSDAGIIKTVAGSGETISSGDGGLAIDAGLHSPYDVAFASDSSFYILDSGDRRVRRVDADGVISSISIQSSLSGPSGLAVGNDGSLYIADTGHNRVLRMAIDGGISIFAGTGVSGFSGDEGPAVDATLRIPTGLAVSSDGSLYIVDRGNDRIRKVGVDGIISTVAGNGSRGFSGDGGPATNARLNLPYGVAVAPDGSVYFSDTLNDRVRKVGVDGTITTVAGTVFGGFSGDGGPATSARLSIPTGVAIGNNGDVFIADYDNQRIRRISSDGKIYTIAGDGLLGFEGDNEPATSASLAYPRGLKVAPDGSLFIADSGNYRVRRVAVQNVASIGDASIPSESGDLLYYFDGEGHHLSTRNAITGGILHTFHYDDNKRLVSIEDGDGNITRIERDFEGNPSAIVAPDGQWTSLAINNNGYISMVTNPQSETYSISYTEDGLLTRFTDPNGNSSSMSYDELGRLKSDTDAEGGGWTIERSRLLNGAEYRMTSAEDRLYRYQVTRSSLGEKLRTNIRPDGAISTTRYSDSGEIINLRADGTETVTKEGPDPRFGMASPVPETVTTTTPSGLTRTVTTERTVLLADSNDSLSHTALDQTISINGRTQTSQYNADTRTWVSTSTVGRSITTELDALGRPLLRQLGGLAPFSYTYDNRGRLIELAVESGSQSRLTQFGYDSRGNLASTTDSLLRTSYFDYDLAGRITRQTFPDGRIVDYEYDNTGNLTAIIPPGSEAHLFNYNRVNQEDTYTPPDLSGVQTITRYEYNLDKQLARIIRPDGQNINYSYDTGGRLSQLAIARGQYTYSYHDTTGQLIQITAPDGGLLNYTYDGFLPMSETWSGAVAGSVSKRYDSNFWLTERCVNGGSCVSFSYDDDGLLINAEGLSLVRHTQHGLITNTELGNVGTSYSYNSFGETLEYQASVSGSKIAHIDYQRDALGRITVKNEVVSGSAANESYQYDNAGRLIAVTRNGETTTWQYDSNGNRTHENGVAIASYDEQDRLLSYRDISYSYTENGELGSKSRNGAVTSYLYDEQSNLVAVALPGDINIDYLIDGQNRRIGKKVNGQLVQGFLYADQLNPIAELDGNGDIVARFVYADKVNVPTYMIKGGATYRIISDDLGSPHLVVNANTGEIVQQMDYDVWGNVILDTSPSFQPFGFAGGIYDLHTSLVRFGARDYDPEAGRWTAKDPIRFQGGSQNLFAYLSNSPINDIDVSGFGPYSFAACTALNGALTVKSYHDLANMHAESNELTQDLLRRVNEEIAECPSSDVTRYDALKDIQNNLNKALLSNAQAVNAEGNMLGLGDVGRAAAIEGGCVLLLRAPIP